VQRKVTKPIVLKGVVKKKNNACTKTTWKRIFIVSPTVCTAFPHSFHEFVLDEILTTRKRGEFSLSTVQGLDPP
jgi:hypothetical protein